MIFVSRCSVCNGSVPTLLMDAPLSVVLWARWTQPIEDGIREGKPEEIPELCLHRS